MTILLAACDRDLLSCCAAALERAGYEVTSAFDGASASDHISTGGYDAAIIDDGINAPGITTLVGRLLDADFPVVVLSKSDDSVRTLTSKTLACSHLPYPFGPGELTEKLASVLDKAGRETVIKADGGVITVRGFTLENKVRVTNEEIDFLNGNAIRESGLAYVYAASLNEKFGGAGIPFRMVYRMNEGFGLVNANE